MADFGCGHDLTVCGFEPRIRLCADSSEQGYTAVVLFFRCIQNSFTILDLMLDQLIFNLLSKPRCRGIWVVQSVERPTSAQVMISQSMSLSPASGSVLTAQSLEPASDSVSPSLSLLLPRSCSVFLCLKNKYKHLKKLRVSVFGIMFVIYF